VEKLQSQLQLPTLQLPQQALSYTAAVDDGSLPSLPPLRKGSGSDSSGDGHFVIVEREECPLPGEVGHQKPPAKGEEAAATTNADAATTDATRSLRRASSTSINSSTQSSSNRKSSTDGFGPSGSPVPFGTPLHAASGGSASPSASPVASQPLSLKHRRSSSAFSLAEGQTQSIELSQLSPASAAPTAASSSSPAIASFRTAVGLVAKMATRLARARSRAEARAASPATTSASGASGSMQSISVGAGQVRGSAATLGRVRVSEQADAREKVDAHGAHAESEDAEIIGDLRLGADRPTFGRRQAQPQQGTTAGAPPRPSPHRRGMSEAAAGPAGRLTNSNASVIPSLLPSSGLMASLLQRTRSNFVQRIGGGGGDASSATPPPARLSVDANDPLSPMATPNFRPSVGRQSTRVIEYGEDHPGFSPGLSPTNRRAMGRRQPSTDFLLTPPAISAAAAAESPLFASPLMLPASSAAARSVSPGGPSVRGSPLPPPTFSLPPGVGEPARMTSVNEQQQQQQAVRASPPFRSVSPAAAALFGRRAAAASSTPSAAAAVSVVAGVASLRVRAGSSATSSTPAAAAPVAGSSGAGSVAAPPAAASGAGRHGTAISRLASRRQGGAS